jgi:integrase
MARKRGNSEGSIYQRESDGRWVGALTLEDGRRRVAYGATQAEAREKLRQLERRVHDGAVFASGRAVTLGQYLEQWYTVTLTARVRSGRLKASTLDSYRDIVDRHISPALGREPLAKLTPTKVRSWVFAKQSEIGARGRPLSARTVAYCHAVLRAALSDAMRDELVVRNVAALVEPPVVRRDAVKPLSADEASRVFAAADGDRLGVLWLVMLALGLRRGEALGLHWDDIDSEAGTVTIRRSLQRVRGEKTAAGRRKGQLVEVAPKTAASSATIALPDAVVAGLGEHRRAQRAERLRAKVWVNPELVFTTTVGTPLEPRNVNRAWDDLCARAQVRKVRVHDLRHGAASFMLGAGVDMKTIQATLRHSRLSTTADIYAHVCADVQRGAADRMDVVLRALGGAN